MWLAVAVALAALDAAAYLWFKPRLAVWGIAPVEIASTAGAVYASAPTPGPSAASIAAFGVPSATVERALRRETGPAVAPARTALDTVRALRRWVNTQVGSFGPDAELRGNATDPLAILRDVRVGFGANCGPISQLFIGALRANGRPARQVLIFESPPMRRGFGHALAEVFVNGRWIVEDAMMNVEWWVGGRPASAYEARLALARGVPVALDADGPWDPRVGDTRDAYRRAVANQLIVRELPRHWQRLSRWPLFKLQKRGLIWIADPETGRARSPFALFNVLTMLIYGIIPLAGGLALAAAVHSWRADAR